MVVLWVNGAHDRENKKVFLKKVAGIDKGGTGGFEHSSSRPKGPSKGGNGLSKQGGASMWGTRTQGRTITLRKSAKW